MIQVFQAHELQSPFGKLEGWNPYSYQKVADVNIPDEDYAEAYKLTNNIERAWIHNDNVTPATENMRSLRGFRSTSVGDIIILSTGKMLQCAPDGWNLIGFMAVPIEDEEVVGHPDDADYVGPLSRETCEEYYGQEFDEEEVYYDFGFKS